MNFNHVEFEKAFGVSSQLPPSQCAEISFAGRSNVGKSSLLNKLFNRKNLAKVSSTPGKTATINFFRCDGIRFVDLPGYGYARVSKQEKLRWSELIEGYFNQERNFALVCVLSDIRHDISPLDEHMIRFLQEARIPFCLVLTKADKLSRAAAAQRIARMRALLDIADEQQIVPTSAATGAGIDALKQVLAAAGA